MDHRAYQKGGGKYIDSFTKCSVKKGYDVGKDRLNFVRLSYIHLPFKQLKLTVLTVI